MAISTRFREPSVRIRLVRWVLTARRHTSGRSVRESATASAVGGLSDGVDAVPGVEDRGGTGTDDVPVIGDAHAAGHVGGGPVCDVDDGRGTSGRCPVPPHPDTGPPGARLDDRFRTASRTMPTW